MLDVLDVLDAPAVTAPGSRRAALTDGGRLALGTLTVLPVPPPGKVDRRVASWAMTGAPLTGLVLAAPAVALQWLLGWGSHGDTSALYVALSHAGVPVHPLPPPVTATLTVALLALATRGLHLDGLADTADGLGSGRSPAGALAVMRRGDVGPFGIATLLLVLLVQVTALAHLLGDGRGGVAVVVALVAGRLVLPVLCRRGARAARPDGLGASVVGSVHPAQLPLAVLGAAASVGVGVGLLGGADPAPSGAVCAGVATVVAVAAGCVPALWCRRRLGGITGDVLGACVEVACAAALVVLSAL